MTTPDTQKVSDSARPFLIVPAKILIAAPVTGAPVLPTRTHSCRGSARCAASLPADNATMMRACAEVIRIPAPTPSPVTAFGRRAGRPFAAIAPVSAGARNLLAARIDVIAARCGGIGRSGPIKKRGAGRRDADKSRHYGESH